MHMQAHKSIHAHTYMQTLSHALTHTRTRARTHSDGLLGAATPSGPLPIVDRSGGGASLPALLTGGLAAWAATPGTLTLPLAAGAGGLAAGTVYDFAFVLQNPPRGQAPSPSHLVLTSLECEYRDRLGGQAAPAFPRISATCGGGLALPWAAMTTAPSAPSYPGARPGDAAPLAVRPLSHHKHANSLSIG